jgi:chaperonin GroEL
MKKVYDSHMRLSEKVVSGVNKLTDNVASTMGPKGRNVILQQAGRRPIVTKDGVTVARFVDLEDPVENAAAQIIKQAAEETNTLAGDGTTTSTVLARAILVESQKYLASGVSPVELKRGMEKACKLVVEKLKEDATEVKSLDDLRHVATISANNDPKIGNLIAEAIDLVGKDGAISVKEGRQSETTLETVEGFRIKGGLAAGVFATDERSGALKYDNPLILVTDEKLDAIAPLMPTLELAARDSRPLLIVAEEVTGEALAALVTNAVRGTLKVAAVKAPAYGNERRNILKDLATSVGAVFVSAEVGKTVEEIQLADLGSAEFVEANKLTTTIMGGECDPDLLDQQIERLKAELEITEDLDECEKIQERITRLASGIAVIHVGGSTEVEMLEAKHRIEDALEAVKSAQDEGIVPGGGIALLQSLRERESLKEKVDDWNHPEQKVGFDIVMNSLSAPLRQMAVNAGISGDIAVDRVLKSNLGLNLYDESEVDMMEAGIIDPVKVTRTALQNAVSVAGTLITTNHAIIEVDK